MTFPTAEDIEVKTQREPISTYDSDHDRASYYLEINPPFDTEKEAIETKQQILSDHTKAEKYDSLMKANSEIVQNNINTTLDHEIVERLKEQIEFQRSINPANYNSSSLLHILKSILENK